MKAKPGAEPSDNAQMYELAQLREFSQDIYELNNKFCFMSLKFGVVCQAARAN